METEKAIESFKRYINSQEQKLDDYYRMDEEFYKDEIEQLELSLKLLRKVLNHLTKQEKMIDLMAEDRMLPQGCRTLYNVFNKQDVINFYERLAEESE